MRNHSYCACVYGYFQNRVVVQSCTRHYRTCSFNHFKACMHPSRFPVLSADSGSITQVPVPTTNSWYTILYVVTMVLSWALVTMSHHCSEQHMSVWASHVAASDISRCDISTNSTSTTRTSGTSNSSWVLITLQAVNARVGSNDINMTTLTSSDQTPPTTAIAVQWCASLNEK